MISLGWCKGRFAQAALAAFTSCAAACGGASSDASDDATSGQSSHVPQVATGAGGTAGSSAGGTAGTAAGGAAGTSPGGTTGTGAGGTAGTGGGGNGGAPADDLEVIPAMYGGDGQPTVPITDGDAVPLTFPLQGGHVLMLGARIRNLHTDTVLIRGRLRDPDTGAIVGEDTRTVVVQPVDGDPTLVQTNIQTNSQVANIPACPNYTMRPVNGLSWTLEVTITELYVDVPRTVTATRAGRPRRAR